MKDSRKIMCKGKKTAEHCRTQDLPEVTSKRFISVSGHIEGGLFDGFGSHSSLLRCGSRRQCGAQRGVPSNLAHIFECMHTVPTDVM